MSVTFSTDQVKALLDLEGGTVNPPQAAVLLGLSPSTVVRRIKSGDLQGYKYGDRSYRIPANEVLSFMAKSAVAGGGTDDNDVLTKAL